MKKLLLFITIFTFGGHSLQAQYCGSSGGFTCAGIDSSSMPGYNPSSVSLAPFINNLRSSATVQFTSFDSIFFGTEVLYVYSTTIDSINNLPNGLCWTTNQDSNKYLPAQIGCIKIEGIPCDYTGQYKIPTILSLDISGGTIVVTDGDAAGMEYFIRLNNPGDTIIPVDTTQTDSTPLIFYGGICTALDTLTISMNAGQNVCNGSILLLSPTITGGEPPYTYLWQAVGNALSCDTCQYPVTTITENSVFIFTVTDFNGNVAADTINYTVSGQLYNFNISAEGPVTYCDTGTVTLASHPGVAATYQWYLNNNAIPAATDSLYDATNLSGGYFLQFNLPGCEATSNIINVSFNNVTPALVTTPGSANLCAGNVVILQADSGIGLSYQWIYNDSIVQSNNPIDTVALAGNYQLVITNALQCMDTSAPITVTTSVNLPPQVTFDYYSGDTLCVATGPFSLIGGYPDGGNYSGPGIWGNIFYPDSAITGDNIITYTYTDSNNCSNWATDTINIETCTGIENADSATNLSVYPNPTTGMLNIVTDIFLQKYRMNMYDVAGRRVAITGKQDGDNKIVMDVTQLRAGMYYIELIAGDKIAHASFVKTD